MDFKLENCYLGIEFGSTNIKTVLLNEEYNVVETGSYTWENQLINGIWTYSMDDAIRGLQNAYKNLNNKIFIKHQTQIKKLKGIGISGMMHGYLPFDKEGKQLTDFRTWRNTMTEEASNELSQLFDFHIPQRWSIAHLYQAILNKENHVKDIDHITTLAGYIHWKLTDQKVMGIGEASGMFPIDSEKNSYDEMKLNQFNNLIKDEVDWKIEKLLPKVVRAGEMAGTLTETGARLIDPTGMLEAGIPFCPCEGDAGTGMVATNSVKQNTGNVSAGTSVFAMIVLNKQLSKMYEEIDLVTTPDGSPVAMVHCNNCTSDINDWVEMFFEYSQVMNQNVDIQDVYTKLYSLAFQGDPNCGGLLNYNYLSGEHITNIQEGRPLFVRLPDSKLSLANFMKAHIFSALSSLKVGLDIFKNEYVAIQSIVGHGGFFKTKNVGQRAMAAAIEAPVGVMETAGEGGPYGMALLAAYMDYNEVSLSEFLEEVFSKQNINVLQPDPQDVEDFDHYYQKFKAGLEIELKATQCFKMEE